MAAGQLAVAPRRVVLVAARPLGRLGLFFGPQGSARVVAAARLLAAGAGQESARRARGVWEGPDARVAGAARRRR